jgi:hypothetical protein
VSPKVEDKKVFEWLLEYVLVFLKWYGVESRHVKGVTSDVGSDCKKVFNKLVQEYGWMCLWCFPHVIHYTLVEYLDTQLDRRKTTNPEGRGFIDKVRRVCGKITNSPPIIEVFKNIQQILVGTQRNTVQEEDLGRTLSRFVCFEIFYCDVCHVSVIY